MSTWAGSCRGRMRNLATIHRPEAIRAILDCLGPPPRAAACGAHASRHAPVLSRAEQPYNPARG